MKQYCVLTSLSGSIPIVISTNSTKYLEYIDSGYRVVKSGNKRECEVYAEELIGELADID